LESEFAVVSSLVSVLELASVLFSVLSSVSLESLLPSILDSVNDFWADILSFKWSISSAIISELFIIKKINKYKIKEKKKKKLI